MGARGKVPLLAHKWPRSLFRACKRLCEIPQAGEPPSGRRHAAFGSLLKSASTAGISASHQELSPLAKRSCGRTATILGMPSNASSKLHPPARDALPRYEGYSQAHERCLPQTPPPKVVLASPDLALATCIAGREPMPIILFHLADPQGSRMLQA